MLFRSCRGGFGTVGGEIEHHDFSLVGYFREASAFASGKGYRFIPVEQEIADKLCQEYQYFGYDTLKSTVYDNNPVDTPTMIITNMVIVRADMEEDVVYEMTKAMFENLDTIKGSHKAAAGLSLEGAVRTSIPLHPGAERYFKEIGAI